MSFRCCFTKLFLPNQPIHKFDHRSLPHLSVISEFFPPDSLPLEVTVSRSLPAEVELVVGDRITHLAEFHITFTHQLEIVKRTSAELERAMCILPINCDLIPSRSYS